MARKRRLHARLFKAHVALDARREFEAFAAATDAVTEIAGGARGHNGSTQSGDGFGIFDAAVDVALGGTDGHACDWPNAGATTRTATSRNPARHPPTGIRRFTGTPWARKFRVVP